MRAVDRDRVAGWLHPATSRLPAVLWVEQAPREIGVLVLVTDPLDRAPDPWLLRAWWEPHAKHPVSGEVQGVLTLAIELVTADPTHDEYLRIVESIALPALDHHRFTEVASVCWDPDTGRTRISASLRDFGQTDEVMRAQASSALHECIALLYAVTFRIWHLRERYTSLPGEAAAAAKKLDDQIQGLLTPTAAAPRTVPGP